MKWHPDKHEGDEKKVAEKKFYDIAAAKEVLSDPGKYITQFTPFLLCPRAFVYREEGMQLIQTSKC
jgi:hypothetical protein